MAIPRNPLVAITPMRILRFIFCKTFSGGGETWIRPGEKEGRSKLQRAGGPVGSRIFERWDEIPHSSRQWPNKDLGGEHRDSLEGGSPRRKDSSIHALRWGSSFWSRWRGVKKRVERFLSPRRFFRDELSGGTRSAAWQAKTRFKGPGTTQTEGKTSFRVSMRLTFKSLASLLR